MVSVLLDHTTTGIPMSGFPPCSDGGDGVGLLKGIMSSCVVGNLFLPGQLAKAKLNGNSYGLWSYGNDVEPLWKRLGIN